ncbi:phosphoribosylformylglycinamidine synthase subunit PurL [Candidatus Bathyarchaeota archaeon]|nr:phosphoribosylformylglycinamidine synthase subunit PurL [Candidatus Bathyarchaeota archaeon]
MSGMILIFSKSGEMEPDEISLGEQLSKNLASDIEMLRIAKGYSIEKRYSHETLDTIGNSLLVDPIVESYSIDEIPWEGYSTLITVGYKPGVTDNVGHTASIAINDLGLEQNGNSNDFVHSFTLIALWGVDSTEELIDALHDVFNPIVEFANISSNEIVLPRYDLSTTVDDDALVQDIPIIDANDEELIEISKKGLLALNLEEMKAIQAHYKELSREPTDIELETFAQTWSEHCVHKTLKSAARLEITDHVGKKQLLMYDNLIKETIFAATRIIRENGDKDDICVSVFKDNAGIIKFNENFNICFKVETHNHPSAKEPYGGAATGIGGVIRDILAAGMGAKPIANTDIFCFSEPNISRDEVPEGIIHPKEIMKGVVAGVRDYGNPMGIPTVNGSVYFDKRYLGNPLVFCGTAGIIPRKINGKPSENKEPNVGDYLVVIGGKTGRDGIHGVTFASLEMDKHTSSNPVQIGDPITERMFMEAMFKARDKGLYTFVQDCGGGGLSSAFGEMGAELGCEIHLEKVPLKYQGLLPWEIWISESQERQAFSVPPEHFEEFKEIFELEGVGVYHVGMITGNKKLVLKYGDLKVGEIEMDFLHNGVPLPEKEATWRQGVPVMEGFEPSDAPGELLKEILASWNVCSKEWIVRQYDSEVQGNTILKPLQGCKNDGPGDGSVIKPDPASWAGIALSNGMNPFYGDFDPYLMAASSIDEALRNIVCCGADPNHVAILDNFCWGNPRDPEHMAKLILACKACKDIATGFETPFISGKDSLNNEYKTDDGVISIPATLLISAIGKVEDIRNVPSMFLKSPGNFLCIVGETRDELGGSHYLKTRNLEEKNTMVPTVDTHTFMNHYRAIHECMNNGLIASMHDCSEGGLITSISEMCFSGELGATIHLKNVPRDFTEDPLNDILLFSESNGRILVEIPKGKKDEFIKAMEGKIMGIIGEVTSDTRLLVEGIDGNCIINESISDLKRAWQAPLDLEHYLGTSGE